MNHGKTVYGDVWDALAVASKAVRAEYLPPCPVQSAHEQYGDRLCKVCAADSHYIKNVSYIRKRISLAYLNCIKLILRNNNYAFKLSVTVWENHECYTECYRCYALWHLHHYQSYYSTLWAFGFSYNLLPQPYISGDQPPSIDVQIPRILYHTLHQQTFRFPLFPAFLELSNHDSSGYFLVAQFYWCSFLRKLVVLIVLVIFGDTEPATIFTYVILHSSFCCTGSCILLSFFLQKYTIHVLLIALMSIFLFRTTEQVL
jgi:hypothetical protein